LIRRLKEGGFSFYWVVPLGIVNHWKDYVQKKCKGDGDILQQAVKYVEQLVLELPVDNNLDQKLDVREMFRPRKRQEDK